MVEYYCPFCGTEAYRGHRDYKCDNDECENHENPVFTLDGKPLGRNTRQTTDSPTSTSEVTA